MQEWYSSFPPQLGIDIAAGHAAMIIRFHHFGHSIVDFGDGAFGLVLAMLGFEFAADDRESAHNLIVIDMSLSIGKLRM